MKNIILIYESNNYEFNNIDELREFIIPNHMKVGDEEIQKFLYEKIFGYSMIHNLQIAETTKGVYEGDYEIGDKAIDIERAIIINNIDTYILSLCRFNEIVLLEEKDNRFFTRNLQVNVGEDNYIVVNAFARSILNEMVGEQKYE